MKTPNEQSLQNVSQRYWKTKLQLERISSGEAKDHERNLTVEQVELLQNFIEACEDVGIHLVKRRVD